MPARPNKSHPEKTLLDAATGALGNIGITARVHAARGSNTAIDLRFGKGKTTYIVECKRSVNSANIGLIAHRLADIENPLLVAEYIAPPVADRLRDMHIQFVDAAGNAFINAPPILIWVTGRKPETVLPASRVMRAFQPGGLKLIFALLCKPELAEAAYRDIAEAADVALGTVGWVVRDLKETGYLLDLGKRGRKLVNRRKLLDQWVEAYAQVLRPKLLIGHFRSLTTDWQHGKKPAISGILWGGETAAAKLTGYLRPAVATIYLHKNSDAQHDIIKTLRLAKDAEGNVELRHRFWHFDSPENESQGMVPPLLVYADLIATADGRNIETARMIYDSHLARLVEPS